MKVRSEIVKFVYFLPFSLGFLSQYIPKSPQWLYHVSHCLIGRLHSHIVSSKGLSIQYSFPIDGS